MGDPNDNTTEETGKLRTIFFRIIRRCLMVLVPLLAVMVTVSFLQFPEAYERYQGRIISITLILSAAWIVARVILEFDDLILLKYDLSSKDNLRARAIYTQVYVIQRISLVVLAVLTFAAILLVFPMAQRFGQTILASAGVASIIIGLALQKALGNLFAGIQIAFTQPIRHDDVVIVENEWGWIEEITLTYVVVKIWDWRRLVVPISNFIEKPFQNWTRSSASIIGTIFMYVDYTVPVDELRAAFEKIVKSHRLWDGQVYCLQVTECKDKAVELRVLVSAANSPEAWDLRCDVREAMLEHVQKHYPQCLPQVRLRALGAEPSPEEVARAGAAAAASDVPKA
ncbi:MAG: mechanosensitive ion channel family protein [Verrucomicrobiota bacterium]